MPQTEYQIAQRAMAYLKLAIQQRLRHAPASGLHGEEIGRSLGILPDHIENGEDLPLAILQIMREEGVVEQWDSEGTWVLVNSGAE